MTGWEEELPAPVEEETPFRRPAEYESERPRRQQTGEPTRMLPAAMEAEKGVLCSILLAPKEVCALCENKGVQPADFHFPAHAALFAELMAMWDAALPIDVVTLNQRLHDRKQMTACGGAGFVAEIYTFLPTVANVEQYLGILEQKRLLRNSIVICHEVAEKAYGEECPADELVHELEKRALAVRRQSRNTTYFSGRELARVALEEIERRIASIGRIGGISTGFLEIDLITDGLHEEELIVLASQPNVGKSALAMQIMENIAMDQGIPVAVYPLEMGKKQTCARAIYSRARVNPLRWNYGHSVSDFEIARMQRAMQDFAEAPMHFDTVSDTSISYLRSGVRRMVHDHGVRVVLIDSLSKITAASKQAQASRVRELAEATHGCKEMAKELGLRVLLIHHTQKDSQDPPRRPRMGDLRDSGSAISSDADSVWFLWESMTDDKKQMNFSTAKQRFGERDMDCVLSFEAQYTRYNPRAAVAVQHSAELL